MEKKTDLRYQRTHKSIREAFETLILQKDYDKITVKELSEAANINRKTFYLHFNTIDELLIELEAEIAERLIESFRKELSQSTPSLKGSLLKSMNEIINENYELHMRLMSTDKYQFFVEKVQELIFDELMTISSISLSLSPEENRLAAFGIANGILSIYRMNYKQKLGLSLDQIAKLVDKLMSQFSAT